MKLDYDTLAREYALHRQVQPEVLKGLIQTGALHRTAQVLDVGCGTGNYLVALEKAVGCTLWGVEPSQEMLAVARERLPRVDLKIGRAEKLAYPDGFFDLVFSVDVIHHVGDRSAYFREAFRVLKPGGRVCTVTDSEDIIRRRQPLTVYFPESVAVELQRYPAIVNLREKMVEAGFGNLQEALVEFPYLLADIQPYRDKAFSSLHLISTEAFERGVQRMENDLKAGPIPCVSRYLLLWGRKGLNDEP